MPIEYHTIPFGSSVVPGWIAQHLSRTGDEQHFPSIEDVGCFGFVASDGCQVVGHVSVRTQRLALPALPDVNILADHLPTLSGYLGSLPKEAFVQTFSVEQGYRRRGIGRRLQEMAIEHARRLGCLQLRSWSSADRLINYRLKLGLGFSIVPGYSYIERIDQWIPGAWFVMPLVPPSKEPSD